MSNKISHIGCIESISEGMVRVRITQNSACASCKIASHCSSAESKEKLIDVRCNNASRYTLGQEVNVMATNGMGAKAVVLAFVIPTVLIVSTIVIGLQMGGSEATAALAGLAALIPYYIVLYLLKSKIEKTMSFWIEGA